MSYDTAIAILIPVLNRPQAVQPLVDSIAAAASHPCRPLFICTAGDSLEIRAVQASQADHLITSWPLGPGDYARKINLGVERTTEEFVFLGADDLAFHPGWIEQALARRDATGAGVIGTNDLGNSTVMAGHHATHSLVHRAYATLGTIDDPGRLLHEGYDHNWVDNEFVETAKARGEWAHAADSHVEHLHPFWAKGTDDTTYLRGRAGYEQDKTHYLARRSLWEAI